ncbi:MAG: putative lipid II flippase FtsW [Proteobacteria bacterium]|nr:putative lipid II flippase FtsW [Pseudomonadota bacterium]
MEQNSELEKTGNFFLITTILILFFGVVMVFSASYMYARENFGSPTYFLFKQIIFITFGVGASFLLARTKVNFWYKYAYQINGMFIGLLALTQVPGIGVVMKGSHRWINLGFMNLQPGEFVKYSIILAAIKYFENFNLYPTREKAINSLGLILPLLIFLKQPDFGTFAISSLLLAFIAYLSHFPRKLFWGLTATGLVGAVALLFGAEYRVKRILVFLDPWSDPKNSGFQIIQSFLAFAQGGVTGQGLGNSNEKLFYLPESYNDFIFSVIGEELGFIGVVGGVVLFLGFIYLGFKLALSLRSRLSSLLVCSIVFCVGIQAFLNMGVVLGLLPTKGLNLPFISYGGSSMVANLAALGLVFSAIRWNGLDKKEPKKTRSSKALSA